MSTRRTTFRGAIGWKWLWFGPIGGIILLLTISGAALAAPLRNVPQTLVQPDGEILECFASGDEYHNWLHDQDGYVIIQDHGTGYYVYAREDGGDIVPTHFVPGWTNPEQAGLQKNVRPSPARYAADAQSFRMATAVNAMAPGLMPATGTVNNIVVFIRFHDEPEYTDQLSTFDDMFNSTLPGANSQRNYFTEVSYGQLSVSTTFYPTSQTGVVVSYRDVYDRGYYLPYDYFTNPSGYLDDWTGKQRLDAMFKRAVDAISAQVPVELSIDQNGDGLVDSIVFVVTGSPAGWSDMLWPHWWVLIFETPMIRGKEVYAYNLQLRDWLVGGEPEVGVLCHEMCHSVGMPDLYHYYYSLSMAPVGPWDIMEDTSNPPQGVDAYLRYRYAGWIDSIPVISSPATYTLDPLGSSGNQCYKILSPNSTTEHFVVEYRRKTGTFESSLPGSGLLIYRINTTMDGWGNSDGPPDEVYVYRPGGTPYANGSVSLANFSSDVSRTEFGADTNPSSFLSNGNPSGVSISEIGSAGDTISFYLGAAPAVITNKSSMSVPEGGVGYLGVKLSRPPVADVEVTVEVSGGDPDISVSSGASLTFTPSNWSSYRLVTLAVAEDADGLDGAATISCTAEGWGTRTVEAYEADNDRTLTVQTTPIHGVSISGTPSGISDYSSVVTMASQVTLTAPSKVATSGLPYLFYRWMFNGVSKTTGQRQLSVAVDQNSTAVAAYRRVRRLTISGPTRIYERGRGTYRCTAYFTTGPSQNVTKLASWREPSSYLRFVSPGVLQTYAVTRNRSYYITASYGGVTTRFLVTIVNR